MEVLQLLFDLSVIAGIGHRYPAPDGRRESDGRAVAAPAATAAVIGRKKYQLQSKRGLTRPATRHYSFAMSEPNRTSNIEVEFKRLEKRIDELVATIHQLKDENRALRQRQDSHAIEKTTLLNRNEQVRARVEAMIGRLRAMEHGA
jgi:cell division protein ZapB